MIFHEKAMQAANDVIAAFKPSSSGLDDAKLFGRAADHGWSLPWVACMVAQAGTGDHVDVGSLFGASAITAALTKKRIGIPGKVYCVDPFEPRAVVYRGDLPANKREGTPEHLMANAAAMGVELELVQKHSYPWPDELNNKRFASAYIDGNHMGEMPYRDFRSLALRTTEYIGFDNYEEGFRDVADAVHRALQTGDWMMYFKNGGFAAIRRKNNDPERSIPAYML